MDNSIYHAREPYPVDRANFFSKLFYFWFRKIFSKSIRHNYHFNDLYECPSGDKSNELTNRFESNWNYEVTKSVNTNQKPSLLRVIRKTFFWRFAFYSILINLQLAMLTSLMPLLLSHFVHLFSEKPHSKTEYSHHQNMMYIFGASLVVVNLVEITVAGHMDYLLPRLGMRIRIVCSSLVYRKILRLSSKSLINSSSGHVINLLSNDVNNFDSIGIIIVILASPLLLIIAAIFLWYQVQVPGLIGLGLFLLTVPVQVLNGKLMAKLRLQVSEEADERVSLLSEVFSGIRLIKLYAWEKPFQVLINTVRVRELKYIKKALSLLGIILSSWNFTSRSIVFIIVTIYQLTGNEITASKVFSIVVIFNILEGTVAVKLPFAINHAAEALVAIRRIQNFLLLEEKEFLSVSSCNTGEIVMNDVSISWNKKSKALENVTIHIKPGSLCAIVGAAGSGKSSLLQFLLGEITSDGGTFSIGGSISYAAQNPWLFASTAKHNIIFGQDYDEVRYQSVVDVCSLKRDFKLFPKKDETLVGEKGIWLSGGQKARINLARSIYKKSDIYVFDDPLSAVDPLVAKSLFEKCIVGYLKGTTRILVTHQIQYLQNVDQIIVLNQGRVEARGTYQELSNIHIEFTKLLARPDGKPKVQKKESNSASTKYSSSISELFTKCETLMEEDVDEETREVPKSKTSTLWMYLNTGQNRCMLVIIIILLISTQILGNCIDLWLTFWTQHHRNHTVHHNSNSDLDNRLDLIITTSFANIPNSLSTSTIISIYAAILIALITTSISACLLIYRTVALISYHLHNNMLSSLLNAPLQFFDHHPSGKIINRFSRDMGIVDIFLPDVLHMASMVILIIIGTLIVIFIANPYMIIVVFLLSLLLNKFRKWYIIVAQNMKHLESAAKSPVFTYINATWNGVLTIRAMEMESQLKKEFDNYQDTHTSAWNNYIASIAAFSFWNDLISSFFLFCVVFSFILLNQFQVVSGSLAGLAISQVSKLTGTLIMGISEVALLFSQMTSVERIFEFSNLPQEESSFCIESNSISSWPLEGRIEFKKVYLRYAPTDEPVLKNLNFSINSAEKVGIVGRTGAGKSSLISVLFRLTPIEGCIIIDDVNIEEISVTELRTKITIIPQDPVLFSATIRYNLDPLEHCTDDEIWSALDDVYLKSVVPSLDHLIDEGGSNFSAGQRQLICLARAILRKSKILVLDEATASIDHKTDQLIQSTIRLKFKNCTVLTVAHRLNTIMDSDKIVVMDAGQIVEFDSPINLLQNKSGYFFKMVVDSGLLEVK